MPRKRMLLPEWYIGSTLKGLPDGARLLWIGLQCFCDDWGTHLHSNRMILGELFPHDSEKNLDWVSGRLDELFAAKVLVSFEYGGADWLYFPKWEEYQRPNMRHRAKTVNIEPSVLTKLLPKIFNPEAKLEPAPERTQEEQQNLELFATRFGKDKVS